MKVADLILELQDMDPEAEVHFAYNYGDHWRTEVAPKVCRVDEGVVEYSDYHRMDRIAKEDYDDEVEFDDDGNEIVDETQRRVVVLA
jgi:hypothetical protein